MIVEKALLVCIEHEVKKYSSPLLPMGDTFRDPRWMPEAADSAEHYIHIMCFPICAYL